MSNETGDGMDVWVGRGPGHVPTINHAVTGARPGTTVYVEPGEYREDVHLTGDIEIRAARPGLINIINQTGALTLSGDRNRLTGVTITHRAKGAAVSVHGTDSELSSCSVSSDDVGIRVQAGGSLTLTDSAVRSVGNAVHIPGAGRIRCNGCELYSIASPPNLDWPAVWCGPQSQVSVEASRVDSRSSSAFLGRGAAISIAASELAGYTACIVGDGGSLRLTSMVQMTAGAEFALVGWDNGDVLVDALELPQVSAPRPGKNLFRLSGCSKVSFTQTVYRSPVGVEQLVNCIDVGRLQIVDLDVGAQDVKAGVPLIYALRTAVEMRDCVLNVPVAGAILRCEESPSASLANIDITIGQPCDEDRPALLWLVKVQSVIARNVTSLVRRSGSANSWTPTVLFAEDVEKVAMQFFRSTWMDESNAVTPQDGIALVFMRTSNIEVADAVITSAKTGIHVVDCAEGHASSVYLQHCRVGVIVAGTSRLELSRSFFRDCVQAGVQGDEEAVLVVTKSSFSGNAVDILTPQQSANRVEDCDMSDGRRGPSIDEVAISAGTGSVAGRTMEDLVGLEEVKKRFDRLRKIALAHRSRRQHGLLAENIRGFHMVFLGGPGTGKTTVARLAADLLHECGVIPHNKLVEVGRADLTGKWVGETAGKVAAVFDGARGGVLFIDEAYALAEHREASYDVGAEAISELVRLMETYRSDTVVIVAGYPAEMRRFLASNAGLASRFAYELPFTELTPEQLVSVVVRQAAAADLVFGPGVQDQLQLLFSRALASASGGSARRAEKVLDEMLGNQAERLPENASREELQLLTVTDIPAEVRVYREIDERALAEVKTELHELLGLGSVKAEIEEVLAGARFALERAVPQEISRHIVFTGPPGTGKNTVARILGKAYAALGILSRGHYTEVGREDLVAGFLGQTSEKVRDAVENARGGVMLIDEAYSLSRATNGADSFGQEAIDVLLRLMEEYRDDLVVIAAGYPQEMTRFLDSNTGLRGRFTRRIGFPQYDIEDLVQIFRSMVRERGFGLDDAALPLLRDHLEDSVKASGFSNARHCRQLADLSLDVFAVHHQGGGSTAMMIDAAILADVLKRADTLHNDM